MKYVKMLVFKPIPGSIIISMKLAARVIAVATELPPRVEYELTDRGKSMLKPLAGFTDWIRDTWQDIEASRTEFDAAERRRG
ncbi:winged helix-turn-helix transcriptional regulator [Rhizobium sp. ERR 1071]|uniref:winged helix-turn-helix transcriptional regulator n=1 Tax=Rhizobium sp. ERR 1071 TaxID=2572677 RepID=UPI0011A61AA2|nr:winged helix-turn-helix transcriptional regulator [Rhizobium sp. ERR1071]